MRQNSTRISVSAQGTNKIKIRLVTDVIRTIAQIFRLATRDGGVVIVKKWHDIYF
jgi:hypothetical protein